MRVETSVVVSNGTQLAENGTREGDRSRLAVAEHCHDGAMPLSSRQGGKAGRYRCWCREAGEGEGERAGRGLGLGLDGKTSGLGVGVSLLAQMGRRPG